MHHSTAPVHGQLVSLEGEEFYRIANHDRLRPFFLTLVSDADHWMFLSSTGALTAGRRDPDLALFPYYTDDKIHDSAEITGSKTLLRVRRGTHTHLWEPFSERFRGLYRVRRNLYKSLIGNQIYFEEINHDLGLTFRYGWSSSERFGFVRTASLANQTRRTVKISLLDGIQNLLPYGIASQFQLEKSTLVDAYKKSELLPANGLGLFTLSSIPIDRPEPAEALRATTVWSTGLRRHATLLCARQLDCFRDGQPLTTETDIRAERGAYFIQSEFNLRAGQSIEWRIVADVNRGPSDVAELSHLLRAPARLTKLVLEDVARGTRELRRIIASADGLQKSSTPISDARHASNVLFNVMRGGVFTNGYKLDPHDLRQFITHANRTVATRHAAFFRKLSRGARIAESASCINPELADSAVRAPGESGVSYSHVVTLATATGDPQLERLCREYLPLTFSRRHGDPSRPWNRFSLRARQPDGRRAIWYEGNWRDIFQNWEALAISFPGFLPGMICRFVNASTADGYNPYRITRDGIDWEVADPHDPWSFIGYWGDHQIVYLLKLLEALEHHDPETLRALLGRRIFSYANVPYRIKAYADLLANPKDTVEFDQAREELVQQRVKTVGADGKLAWDRTSNVLLVNLTEKLLVSLLAKLTNFVPGAGLWLNTQRPEWNDANNALVGNGASVVTLCYLRRMLTFCLEVFQSLGDAQFEIAEELAAHLQTVKRVLRNEPQFTAKVISDRDRQRLLDTLGEAGSRYREQIYAKGFSGRQRRIGNEALIQFFSAARAAADHTIHSNRGRDRLYHSYNLLDFEGRDGVSIRRLYAMLEGQVAVLSSGLLSPDEALSVLRALRRSAMYRADQHSYLLYPDRRLPRFVEKNDLPRAELNRSPLLCILLAHGNRRLIERDVTGRVHFNGDIKNARDVRQILDELATHGYAPLVKRDADRVLQIFERLFDHQSFTGRSGTFFGYEGLGCIYWHMVSKLLLAAQENFLRAEEISAPAAVRAGLAACYHDIRAGLGDRKSPTECGAFPTDPYSHTPAHTGARQPGLTGQVKEDILCRFGELGVSVIGGQIQFRPRLLRRKEFLAVPGAFRWFDHAGIERRLSLPANSLAFTYCQITVIYRIGRRDLLTVHLTDGSKQSCTSDRLDVETSRAIFARNGKIGRIEVVLRRG
ncbi:MAG: hypothetical protein KIS67_10300 [Verrucomicrobiae bacterium]|nr:hypothetical protein [Verrucomicrobiae bacterium]